MSIDQAQLADSQVTEVLLKALQRADEPATAGKLREGLTGPFKIPEQEIQNQLNDLVARGEVFLFEPYKSKSPRFWAHSQEEYARRLVLKKVSQHPKTWSEIQKSLKAPLKGFAETRLSKLKKEMLEAGELRELPAFVGARTTRFSNSPPNPADYIENALKKVQEKLSKFGVDDQGVRIAALELLKQVAEENPPGERGTLLPGAPCPLSPPPDVSLEKRILERMTDIVPGAVNGALVSLRDLRRSMDFQNVDAGAFDQAVLSLANQGKVALHRHDFPAGLSVEERAEMVSDKSGGYYVGIALRQ